MTNPNPSQQRLIDSTDGLYLVDAGAGTGKTFSVTRRYSAIVDQPSVEPEDVVLITFTRNAAREMKDRIVSHSSYTTRELADAPIQTFHSLCSDILDRYGSNAPQYLGIDDTLSRSSDVIEESAIESSLFAEFISTFTDSCPEHHPILRVVTNPGELRSVLNNLAARGIFPTKDGWYRDGRSKLLGDLDGLLDAVEAVNQPRNGGRKQSVLKKKLYRYGKDSTFLPDALSKPTVRGNEKAVPVDPIKTAFNSDRSDLIAFIHDLYFSYLEFALARNYLTFSMLQLYTFVLLCENSDTRSELAFEYTMIDEFQDTSEIQFKLALLLAGTENICVVGDWKQSIYSFQYATVENITQFGDRLTQFTNELNSNHTRITYPTTPVETIELEQNYRSTQEILDFAEHALTTPSKKSESIDAESIRERIVHLFSNSTYDETQIEALQSQDETLAVLSKIDEIVGNPAYAIEQDGDLIEPSYGDIAVLTRTHDFGRELLSVAEEYHLPVAYEGGVELFRSDAAKRLLAWLRILESDADRGWSLVLEDAGYGMSEIKHILKKEAYPTEMIEFRDALASLTVVSSVARRVFDRYGHDGPIADALVGQIQSAHDQTTMTIGDLSQYIKTNIENGNTYDISTPAGTDSVTVQTIHAAKGLEYPIVIVANMNQRKFPPSGGGPTAISYDSLIGIRQRYLYDDVHSQPHQYDNWRYDLLNKCLPDQADEERRLLYVAITRAQQHVLFTAQEPNQFLTDLPVPIDEYEPSEPTEETQQTEQSTLSVPIPDVEEPVGYSPHSLMAEEVYESVTEGRGMEFGTQVHEFAEDYVAGITTEPTNDDERAVVSLIDSLTGEIHMEEDVYLPLTADGADVMVRGIVDLFCVHDDRVEIIDFKTDLSRYAESEYQKQLSVYYHVIRSVYPDRQVSVEILYTATGERQPIEPLSKNDLKELIK